MGKISNFFNRNSQFFYSILLVVIIPVFIVANVLWQIHKSQVNMTHELQRKAILAENILGSSVSEFIKNPIVLQNKIDRIKKENGEIDEITILKQVSDGFIVIASSDSQVLGVKFTSKDYIDTWNNDTPLSVLSSDNTKVPTERLWSVTSLIKDSQLSEKIALINLKISLADIDVLTQKDLNFSVIFLIISILLVVLLLINFFHFLKYAVSYKKLKEVDKMKDDFLSLSSHELKTPMAAIKGYLSMMFEGIAGQYDEKTKTHLLKINENVVRLDTLVSQLLDVSKLEQGRMQFDQEPYDVSGVVMGSINIFRDQAAAKNLTLQESKHGALPLIFIDPDRFRQVMDNLISNAIKYTFKGGVTVYYKIIKNNLQIIVKDTGIGISDKDKGNLFNKYYRIKNEKTVDVTGNGLGLWITREIVLRMNGKISIESKDKIGSEFILSFTIVKDK